MTGSVRIRAFVQARMSSRRFPGKVLAPYRDAPIIDHVVDAVTRSLPQIPVVVTTSTARSDDPLAAHLAERGIACVRGPLDDVVARFCRALVAYPCEFVLRICADSPSLSTTMLSAVVSALADDDVDLITTTLKRSFPRGQNAELIRATTLLELDRMPLEASDREHVTSFLHRHPDRYRLLNVESGDSRLAELNLGVDTIEDLRRLEALSAAEMEQFEARSARKLA